MTVTNSAIAAPPSGDFKITMLELTGNTHTDDFGFWWLAMNGQTIGAATSAATQASSKTKKLFTRLWSNTKFTISSGRGASADADWAANKTLTLIDARGRSLISSGQGGGLTNRTVGQVLGAEAVAMTQAEMPFHGHPINGGILAFDGIQFVYPAAYAAGAGTSGVQIPNTGGSQAHNNMPPGLVTSLVIATGERTLITTIGGFSPLSLSPLSWIDLNQETPLANGAPVTTLKDFANASRLYLASAVAGTYQSSVRNQKPIMRSVSNTGVYSANAAISVPASTPFLIWFAMQTNGTDAIPWGNQSPNNQVRVNHTSNLAMYLYADVGTASGGTLTLAEATAWNIYMFRRDASNQVRFYLNGVQKGTTVSGVTGGVNLGRFLQSYGLPLIGDIGEAGVISAALSLAQINDLGSYLGNKWGITWSAVV